MKTVNLLPVLLLAACSTVNQDVIALAEVQGDYKPPFSREEWALTPWNFYLNRSLSVKGKAITYDIVYDVRPMKAQLKAKYQTNAWFEGHFPAFIRHTGEVDCALKANKAAVNKLVDLDKAPVLTQQTGEMTEASAAVCLLLETTEPNKDKK